MNKIPLLNFKSETIKDLLLDFHSRNFENAGIDKKHAENIVNLTWEHRLDSDYTELRENIDNIFKLARNLAKTKPGEVFSLDLIDFSQVHSVLDIGANKLSSVNYLQEKYSHINKFIAIDLIPAQKEFLNPKISTYYQVTGNETPNEFPVEKESIDLVNLQFVFHHMPSVESIKNELNVINHVLRIGGKFILWEESFENKIDVKLLHEDALKIGIGNDLDLTTRFYNLTEDQKFEFIIVNDWIIQTGNSHMPWTMQYRNWEDWQNLVENEGFKLNRKFNLGLRSAGNLKSGVHIIAEFIKA